VKFGDIRVVKINPQLGRHSSKNIRLNMRIFVISSWAGRFSLAFSLFPFSRPTREFHLDDCTNSENVT
jgi:hypothetical protein